MQGKNNSKVQAGADAAAPVASSSATPAVSCYRTYPLSKWFYVEQIIYSRIKPARPPIARNLKCAPYGVFPLPDSDSDENGYNNNVQKCFQWTYSDSYTCTDSDSNGYCTHFGTDIGTDKVEFN